MEPNDVLRIAGRALVLAAACVSLCFASRPGAYSTDEGELLLDTTYRVGPAPGSQYSPVTAFDGTNYLIVWRTGSTLSAARVSPDGVLLDSFAATLGTGDAPAISFNGENYLATWVAGYNVEAARITPGGVRLDSAPITLPLGNSIDCPRVASDGSDFLVVWEASSNIYAARVSGSGVLLDSTAIPLCTQTTSDLTPDIAFNGQSYLAVWSSGHDVEGVRVSPAGEVLDSLPILLSSSTAYEDNPAVAAAPNGTWLTVWTDRRIDYDVYGTRVASDGAVLDSAGIPVSVAYSYQRYPRLAFNGTDFAAVWEDRRNGVRDIYGARVGLAGEVRDSLGIAICTARSSQYLPAIASDGSRCLAVWEDRRLGSRDIFGARIDTTGSLLDPDGILISLGVSAQTSPATAFDGTNYLTVWQDNRDGFRRIYGVRLTTAGTVLDPGGFPVCPLNADQTQPRVAFDGANYLVTWIDTRGNWICGTRVAPDGHTLDSLGFPVSDTLAYPTIDYHALAFDGTNYLAVWHDNDTVDVLLGARITPAGTVLDTNRMLVSPVNVTPYAPAVAAGTSCWLVAWTGSDTAGDDAVLAARVSPDGVLLDSLGIPLMVLEASDYYPPAVAFDGANFLVTWESWYYDTLTEYDAMFGARIAQSGQLLDSLPFIITAGEYDHYFPTLAYDGTSYVAAWEEIRYGNSDIFGARIAPTGVVTDSFAISTLPGTQTLPCLAHGPNSEMMLAFAGYVDSLNGRFFGTNRIWAKLSPLGGIAEAPSGAGGLQSAPRAYPNPARGRIAFRLPAAATLSGTRRLDIYDAGGRRVRTLTAPVSAGMLMWDGKGESGQGLGNGVYYCRLAGSCGDTRGCSVILVR
jgi:hypothetical protein